MNLNIRYLTTFTCYSILLIKTKEISEVQNELTRSPLSGFSGKISTDHVTLINQSPFLKKCKNFSRRAVKNWTILYIKIFVSQIWRSFYDIIKSGHFKIRYIISVILTKRHIRQNLARYWCHFESSTLKERKLKIE